MSNGSYTVDWAIQKAYTRATGHTDVLATNDPRYLRLLEHADDLQRDWQDEPGINWNSLYRQITVGNITAIVPNYDLDGSIRTISKREQDSVILQLTSGANSGQQWFYDIISPDKLTEYRYRQVCAVLEGQLYFANNPATSIFPVTDARIGAEIIVPSYIYVTDITNGTNKIQVDDPQWLVYMMAAEFVRNDFVRQNQYPSLLAIANNKMEGMRQRNEDQRMEIPVDIDLYDIEPNVGLSSGGFGGLS